MKFFLLFFILTQIFAQQNITYVGFKDFWPLRLDMNDGQANEGTRLDPAVVVAKRASLFFAQYPQVRVISVSYPLYAQRSLQNRDQMIENAPLAVNRRRGDSQDENSDTITNLEVWRYTIATEDEDVFDIVVPVREERVESSASSIFFNKQVLVQLLVFLIFNF